MVNFTIEYIGEMVNISPSLTRYLEFESYEYSCVM